MTCGEVQQAVFREEPEQDSKDSREEQLSNTSDLGSLCLDDADSSDENDGGVAVSTLLPSPPAAASQNLHADPRLRGMQRAKNREMVRQAGRRGATLGFLSWAEGQQKGLGNVEAVQHGKVVEASFAKGEWGIRWKN